MASSWGIYTIGTCPALASAIWFFVVALPSDSLWAVTLFLPTAYSTYLHPNPLPLKRWNDTYSPTFRPGVFFPMPPLQYFWLRNTGYLKNTFWLESSRVGMEISGGTNWASVFGFLSCMYLCYLSSLPFFWFWFMVLWDLRCWIAWCVFQRGGVGESWAVPPPLAFS